MDQAIAVAIVAPTCSIWKTSPLSAAPPQPGKAHEPLTSGN
jgi:hypothetical protein